MARFPKIQSPCPYKGALSDILDREGVCSLCKREVTDLSAMTDTQRNTFYASCGTDACVSYRVSSKSVIVAAMIAAGAGGVLSAAPSFAQEDFAQETTDWVTVIVGGIKGDHIELTEEPIDVEITDLPVIFDDDAFDKPTDSADES